MLIESLRSFPEYGLSQAKTYLDVSRVVKTQYWASCLSILLYKGFLLDEADPFLAEFETAFFIAGVSCVSPKVLLDKKVLK